jgi:hypothetical protein
MLFAKALGLSVWSSPIRVGCSPETRAKRAVPQAVCRDTTISAPNWDMVVVNKDRGFGFHVAIDNSHHIFRAYS